MRRHSPVIPATCCVGALVFLAVPVRALSHTIARSPQDGLDLWSIDPLGAALLALLAFVYALGQWRLSRRSRGERGTRALCFWSGWGALAVALGPPLEALTPVSFAAHMKIGRAHV